ncbi:MULTISPECIES: hypothetical protein [unclassified Rhizobium]|uniref:hypothetical protein n=1 Tax=unclassified Rhizobium TaxID=2613769 RepID=UPI001AE937B7|nr:MULTISPECIES: hypothetical protein [unclassified Rhizobium]MBP2463268.1 hypothetical protein [Rhizobium sp. PvP014]MBP2530663.1 hypothetical protein [Rhizobium sp. PvP099]
MPSYAEVRFYVSGIWLLIKGDEQGFKQLDLSDRGLLRSFWAFVWCLPAMFVTWAWWRMMFLQAMPPGTKTGGLFFFRLGMLEAIDWILPLILVGIVCALFGLCQKFPTMVIVVNWLSVPFAYAYAVLAAAFILPIGMTGFLALLHLSLLIAVVVALTRVMRMLCGPQPLLVTAVVMVLIVPDMLLSEVLQRFLGVYPS